MVNLVGAAGLGLGIGAFAGMPLGVINIAIVDAVAAQQRSYALGLGLGGAVADSVQGALAMLGIGRVVLAHPEWIRVLAIAAAVVFLGYAIIAWRRHHVVREVAGGSRGRGIVAGVMLTLPNPAALGAWVAVAALFWPDAVTGEAIAFAIGVLVGSAVWFTVLNWLLAKLRPDHVVLRYVPRLALVAFVVIAIVGVARTL